MTEQQQQQQQQRAGFLLFFVSIIIFSNVAAGATASGGVQNSEGRISASVTSLKPDSVKNLREFSPGLPEAPVIEEDEYEGEEEEEEEAPDEYAEELRAAAESHEAMSRHEEQATVTNQSHPSGDHRLALDAAKKDFDSREKSVESGSDESETSNETVAAEDEEVTELSKYKNRGENAKRKRVPTVKKELGADLNSTNGSSKVEKRFSTKEMLDELNEQFKYSIGYTVRPASVETASDGGDGIEESLDGVEDDYLEPKPDDQEVEGLEEPRKLDKRQEAVLRDLETYLRAEYAAEQEQQQKLQELGAQEGALAESLLELLVKLAENPRRWERVHRLLMDVEGGLELSRRALEARKRAFNLNSGTPTTTTNSPVSTTPKKPRKKPKKKKKKQRHHRFSTTTTTLPTTVPLLTTTEAPWLTTPMQWRLVAERLFGPPWPQDLQDDPGLAKVRFALPSVSRTSPPSREFVEQLGDGGSKQLQDHKALNTERQALMLESSREYTQPRHLHYGKVSTHQGGSPRRDSPSPRVRDYDPPERSQDYDAARYGRYEFPRARAQPDEFFPVQSYAQNREYRPPGREYAASKGWRDQYEYGRPSWKSEDRGAGPSAKWTWPQLEQEQNSNPGRHRLPNDREFWPRVQHENEGWGRPGDSESWPKTQFARYNEESSPPWETAKVSKEGRKQWAKDEGTSRKPGSEKEKIKTGDNKPQKDSGAEGTAIGSWDTSGKMWPAKAAMSPKIQSVGAWVMPVDQSTWKPYKLNGVEQFGEAGNADNNGGGGRHRWNVQMDTNPRTWPPKMGEVEHWNKFGKPNSVGVTWPKWKQFAYHRVTAVPILSQGASGLQDGSRARNNAYIAVSAVSPKYNGNQWRKNDIEETPVGRNSAGSGGSAAVTQDAEHPVSQLRGGDETPAIYTWKKDAGGKTAIEGQSLNATDPLEEQLETLRRGATWSHNENRDNIKKQLTVISDASETLASRFSSNSSANKPEEETEAAVKGGKKSGNTDQNEEAKHK